MTLRPFTNTDTIVAQATPNGRGGIAVVRISGPSVKFIIHQLFARELKPREATYLAFKDADDEIIDEGLAIFFPHPNSFTGEDILELQGHGGPVVVDLLLQRLIGLGARLARPGEFSERAFLNGKMDLAQVEAIADLIQASSKEAARSAMRSLKGEFSAKINRLSQLIIHLRMQVEAAIDFSDEEINFLTAKALHQHLLAILSELAAIKIAAKQGSLLREGIQAVIVGAPNVGKSSLLNALSGKALAIVTDIPGTTRDVLRDHIVIDGMPLHIIDTAGLRESTDLVEQEGIRRAYQEMSQADILLYLLEANNMVFPSLSVNCPIIYVANKIDLTLKAPAISAVHSQPLVYISAKVGLGIDLLKQQIKSLVGFQGESEGIFLARRRHLQALEIAEEHLKACEAPLQAVQSLELAAEDLRLAHLALGEITGEFTSDDLLGHIFASFCIGK